MNFQIGNLENHYLFEHKRVEKRSTEYSHVHHSILSQDPEVKMDTLFCFWFSCFQFLKVVWVEQQHVKRRSKRDNQNSDFRYQFRHPMSDPLFNEMWYLVSNKWFAEIVFDQLVLNTLFRTKELEEVLIWM